MFIFLSVCLLLVPLSMIILGYTWKNKPPKDRQGISGYQTTMSRNLVPVPGKKHFRLPANVEGRNQRCEQAALWSYPEMFSLS